MTNVPASRPGPVQAGGAGRDPKTRRRGEPGYWRNVWQRLKRDKVTMTVTAILILIFMMAIFAPYVTSP